LSNLTHLLLWNNQLSGCYPESLCDLNFDWISFNKNPSLYDGGSNAGFLAFCNQDPAYYPCANCQNPNACNYDVNATEGDDSACMFGSDC